MNVNKTIPFVVIKNIINDIKTTFIDFIHDPDPDRSTSSVVWSIIIVLLFAFICTCVEAFYAFPICTGKEHEHLFFNDGFNSVLLWFSTFLFSILGGLIIYVIILCFCWIKSLYMKHYYDKYGYPSDELNSINKND